jgi:hypothetical protein
MGQDIRSSLGSGTKQGQKRLSRYCESFIDLIARTTSKRLDGAGSFFYLASRIISGNRHGLTLDSLMRQ